MVIIITYTIVKYGQTGAKKIGFTLRDFCLTAATKNPVANAGNRVCRRFSNIFNVGCNSLKSTHKFNSVVCQYLLSAGLHHLLKLKNLLKGEV